MSICTWLKRVKRYDTSTDYLPAKSRYYQIKIAQWPKSTFNQTFISAECVRLIRLSTVKCQVVSVYGIACDSCPLALSLIGHTRN